VLREFYVPFVDPTDARFFVCHRFQKELVAVASFQDFANPLAILGG
jgi:hypothetical protein